jgi:hypothetical protein
MKQKPQFADGLKVGDRVRLIPESVAWKAEITLQGKIGEVIERRDDGRITVRFDNGRLLMGRDAGSFAHVEQPGLKGRPTAETVLDPRD